MRTKKLGVAAVATGMLALPAAALADSAVGATAHGDPANPTALAQLAPVATPLGVCAHVRWVKPLGPGGGHYVAACPQQPSWVPARGPGGGHYDYATDSCVRGVQGRGLAGGYYVDTCAPQPRWVPARGPGGGHYEYAGTSTTQRSTKPTATASEVASWDFDWESAGIGAAGMIGALAIAITALRRRRIATP